MGRLRHGPLVIAFVAAVACYVVVGHVEHPDETMAEAGGAAGICIVLVAGLVGLASLRPPRALGARPLAPALAGGPETVPPVPVAAPARASPAWLQRFLN